MDCETQFYGYHEQLNESKLYTRTLSDAEAASTAKRVASLAEATRSLLQQRLALHGDLFMSRWKKRSKDKRVDLLLRADANLPEHSGTIMYFTQSCGGGYDWRRSRNAKFRRAVLLPYLNVDALRDNPSLVFALLHNRVEHSLEDWAPFDSHQFRNAWDVGLLALDFSPMCVIMHGKQYGTVGCLGTASSRTAPEIGHSILLPIPRPSTEWAVAVTLRRKCRRTHTVYPVY